jgi:hypothetical protein
MTQHAVYATTQRRDGTPGPTFRIGRPVSLGRAHDRWQRHDRNGTGLGPSRPLAVRFDGRRLPVRFLEVRAVDSDGRGLGSERHALAFTVPDRCLRLTTPKR